MPYDPDYPQNGEDLDADPMRGQLNGLKDLIDAAPGVNAVVVDEVTTVAPGQPATVTLSLIGETLHFTFAIPQGAIGATGGNGVDGGTGPQGPAGPPGEVTTAQMDAAIAGAVSTAIATTPRNPTGSAPFTGTFSDPPTQAEMIAYAAYVVTLRTALLR